MSDVIVDSAERARRKALGLIPAAPRPAVTAARLGDSLGTSAGRSSAAAAASAAADAQTRNRADRVMLIAFAVLIVGATVMQCIGVPVNEDSNVAFIVPAMAAVLIAACWAHPPRIDPIRLGLYLAVVASAGLTTSFFADHYSLASLALFAVLYAPFVLSFEISEAGWRRCLDLFSTVMVAMTALEFIQHAMQLVAGPQIWPNPYKLLPPQLLIPNFNYMQPLVWQSHYAKPQAFVFLETSMLSQFIALGLIVEVMNFRRLWRMALFAAGLFATFAGTGLLLLAFVLPVVLGRASMRTMVICALVLFAATLLAVETGWLHTVGNRLGEFQQNGMSANRRFIEPYLRLVELAGRHGSLWSGMGPGQIEKTDNYQFWPIAKVAIEYGYITAALFYAFYLYVMFDRAPSRVLAFALVMWFTFEGALLTAVNPFMCMMLSSFYLVQRPAPAH